MIIERLYMIEILPFIRKSDKRSAYAWCERNNVSIKRDGRDEFVTKKEFEDAYNKPTMANQSQQKQEPETAYVTKGKRAKELRRKLLEYEKS